MSASTFRITKALQYGYIKSLLNSNGADLPVDANGEEYTIDRAVAFIDSELDLLARKNNSTSKKVTENQKVNAEMKAEIVDFLATLDEDSKGATCSDVIKGKGWVDCSTSKMSRLLWELKFEGVVVRETVKGKSLFRLA